MKVIDSFHTLLITGAESTKNARYDGWREEVFIPF